MKKALSILLAVLLLVAILAGCGGGTSTPAASSGGSSQPVGTSQPSGGGSSQPSGGSTAKPDDGKVYTMRIGSISNPPAPEPRFIQELEAYLEEATDGRIDVEPYVSGTLGTTQQMITGLQDGSVQGVCVPINYYQSYVPQLGVLGLPMLFKSGEQAYRLCKDENSKMHELLDQYMEEKGFVVGAWLLSTDSMIISSKPIKKFEDLNGLKVWSASNSQVVATLQAFGCAPVNFDTGDLAVGIQQKTVDGAYTGPQLMAPLKLYESAGYIFIPEAASINFNVQSFILSKIFVDSLPDDLRETLLEATKRAGVEIHEAIQIPYIDESLQEILDAGTEPYYEDEEFAEKARAAVANIATDFLQKTPEAQELYDVAVAAIEADNAANG